MAQIQIDLSLATLSELQALRKTCMERLAVNMFTTQAQIGGKSFSQEEAVKTTDLLAAVTTEIKKRRHTHVGRTLPSFR